MFPGTKRRRRKKEEDEPIQYIELDKTNRWWLQIAPVTINYMHNYQKDNNAITLDFEITLFWIVFFGLLSSDVEIFDCLLVVGASTLFATTFGDWIPIPLDIALGGAVGGTLIISVAGLTEMFLDEILFSYVDTTESFMNIKIKYCHEDSS